MAPNRRMGRPNGACLLNQVLRVPSKRSNLRHFLSRWAPALRQATTAY
jgi:hypothetical protein